MRGGGRAPGSKIGSSVDEILRVKSWDPADAEDEVPHGHSVKLNVEAIATAEHEVLYDEGSDFLAGSFSDVEIVGDELNLITSPYVEDWEGVTPLNNWTKRLTGSPSLSVIDDGSGVNNVLRKLNWNKTTLLSADNGPNASDVIVKARWQIKNKWDAYPGLAARITGSGTACRGYVLLYAEDNGQVTLRRITGDGSTFLIGFDNSPGIDEVQVDEWCWMALRISGSTIQYKIWMEDESSEPASWKWIATDSVHAGPGDVGIWTRHSTGNEVVWWDDFSAETVPPVYQTSGDWESDPVDVTDVLAFSHGLVTWTQSTPTDTTVAVKCRWPGGSWQTMTNGGILPQIDYLKRMVAGSSRDTLEFRVELATTDTDVTPAVSDLRVYFEPARAEEFEVTVDGASHVEADGTLQWWGRGWIGPGDTSGDPPTLEADWSDLWLETTVPWVGRNEETIAAAFEYWSNAIEAITFDAEPSRYRLGYLRSYWSVPITPFEHGPAEWTWTSLQEWFQMAHTYEWVIVDKGQAIHGDARWLVGHYQIDNFIGSVLPALVHVANFPGSLLVKGYQIDNFLGSLLVQGWRVDNFIGSVLPGVRFVKNFPGSVLVAVGHHTNFPGSAVIFGVNREGAIEINVIDDSTWAALVAEGIGVEE